MKGNSSIKFCPEKQGLVKADHCRLNRTARNYSAMTTITTAWSVEAHAFPAGTSRKPSAALQLWEVPHCTFDSEDHKTSGCVSSHTGFNAQHVMLFHFCSAGYSSSPQSHCEHSHPGTGTSSGALLFADDDGRLQASFVSQHLSRHLQLEAKQDAEGQSGTQCSARSTHLLQL